jgi:Na+/H+ antiporter NhaC
VLQIIFIAWKMKYYKQVEISLFTCVFVGACIVAGNIKDGFKDSLAVYLVGALFDKDHASVVLFTLFLSGMVGMLEKSGGMLGFTKFISQYAKTPRGAQFAVYFTGCMIFFDDYANCLLAGETMQPLTDLLMVSREKLAFIVDATAAPVASISPVSSWVGFEVDLIQTEIDRIIDIVGIDNITITTSGLGAFLQSIKYRYYPIFMIVLMFCTIGFKRDYGPMLIAERKVTIYQRTDGGDGKGKQSYTEDHKANQPEKGTPLFAYNMLIPIAVLVCIKTKFSVSRVMCTTL